MQMNKGFTILEIMVAVAIVAIITSIAVFGNSKNLQKTYRSEVQAKMLELATNIAQQRMLNSGNQTELTQQTFMFPDNRSAKYQIKISPDNDDGFLISATPISGSSQDNDGLICLNEKLQKSWSLGQKSCDSLSDNSTWFGG